MIEIETFKAEFHVGDVIVTRNWYNTYPRTVTKVTKTQAICEVKREDGTGYISKFRKEYLVTKTGDKVHYTVTPIPRIDWNTNEYTVIPKATEA